MTPLIWSMAILGLALAGILGLRTLPERTRITFDIVSLTVVSAICYRYGIMPFPQTDVASPAVRVLTVAWWLLTSRLLVSVLYFALRQRRKSRETKIFVDLIAAAIYATTAMIVLKSVLALPVGGLVATSGVVAIVLGLALQSTLADVFSGIAIGVEAPFQVGDRISLGDQVEGQVIEMNWRSIRVQTDGADIAIIPNSVAAKLQIVNRSVPSRRRAVSVELWCPATSDPDRVIGALQQATLLCPSILADPAPSSTLARMGRRWNSYEVGFSVADTQLVSGAKSQLLRQARKQLYNACLLRYANKGDGAPGETPYAAAILPARQVLAELPLFESLEATHLDHLARQISTRSLEPDEALFTQGVADATLYILASGILEVTQTKNGGSITLGSMGAGEYIGEIGLLTGAAHAATARARTHCYVHCLSRQALEPLLSAHAEMAAQFDRAVRRGQDLLQRSVAVRASEEVGSRSQLLQRIRVFFSHSSPRPPQQE